MKLAHGAYILARYSTDNQEQDSIEVQVENCTAWCDQNHMPVLDVFPDYAVSGMKDTRPQYERMMGLLKQGGADTVVIYDQSRMFRKMTAWFQFRDELENLGVKVVSVTQPMIGGDLKDPSNFLMEGSMALFNQMWVLQTRQKVVEKMRFMARNGSFTGGTPPLGYKVQEGRLVIDPEEAGIVSRIFSMYFQGISYRKIASTLAAEGITTRKGTPFGSTTIHDLLKNKKYIGVIVYGKSTKNPDGSRNSHKASDDVIEIEDGCPAIIDRELFDAVQKKLASRQRSGGPTPRRTEFSLRGKVFCGECNSPMSIHYSGRQQKYAYYECTAQKRTYQCKIRPVKAQWLESYVANCVRERLSNPGNKSLLIDILRERRESVSNSAVDKMAAFSKRRKEVVSKLENATNAILQGLSSPTLIEKIQALENEKASIDYQVDALRNEMMQSALPDSAISSILDQMILNSSRDDAAVLAIVYRVEVSEDEIRVWTIFDCDPKNRKHDGTAIPVENFPVFSSSDISCNCTAQVTGTSSYTQMIIGFRLRRTQDNRPN